MTDRTGGNKTRIRSLAVRHDDTFLDLGTTLTEEIASGVPFKKIVGRKRLGHRKAYYLINIAEKLRPHMRYRVRLQKLGWTKCQLIGAQLPEANLLKLLEYAETHTTKQLEHFIQDRKSKPRTRCVLLYLTDSQYQDFEKAALQFGATRRGRGLVDKEVAIVRMSRTALRT